MVDSEVEVLGEVVREVREGSRGVEQLLEEEEQGWREVLGVLGRGEERGGRERTVEEDLLECGDCDLKSLDVLCRLRQKGIEPRTVWG